MFVGSYLCYVPWALLDMCLVAIIIIIIIIKGPYADHILIPQGSTGSIVHFLISNESSYFSGCKSKILALNSL